MRNYNPFKTTSVMTIKKFINSFLNQKIVAFHSAAIGGTNRGGHDIEMFRRPRPADPPSTKTSGILIAVPSHAVDGPGMKEVSHAYRAFTRGGYNVDFATADGSPVQFSQSDLTDPVNRWFVEDANAKYSAEQPLQIKDVDAGRYAAVYFAGKNGFVTENHMFRSLAREILNNDGVVAGSGDVNEAVEKLDLSEMINSGYSLPTSNSGKSHSEYGSAAAEAVMLESGWMIHKNEISDPETDNITNIGERVIMHLAS